MKNRAKQHKIIRIFLALCMSICVFVFPPSAEGVSGPNISPFTINDRFIVGNFQYKETGPNTAQIWWIVTPISGHLEIPGHITHSNGKQYTVTSIGDKAFWFNSSITSVTIPNTVVTIEDFAFRSCTSLFALTIPNSVISIGDFSFQDCTGLSGDVIIPDSVKSIGDRAFDGSNAITKIKVPSSVTKIASGALGSSVPIEVANQGIADMAMISGVNISRITLTGGGSVSPLPGSTTSTSFVNNGWTYGIINGTQKVILQYTTGATGEVQIPSTVKHPVTNMDYTVTAIQSNAFSSNTNITKVIIPDTVTSIGSYAFSSCSNLSNVTLPNSITTIENGLFFGCSSLISIIIPESVTSIGDNAFNNTNLNEIIIPESVTTIGTQVFSGIPLAKAHIKGSLTYMGSYAFSNATQFICDYPETQLFLVQKLDFAANNLPVSKWNGKQDIPDGAIVTIDSDISISGNVTISNGVELALESGGSITVESGATLNIENGAKIDGQGTINIANGGTLNNNGSCTVTTINVPSKPQNATATAGDSKVDLKWDTPASDGGSSVSGYKVSYNGTNWITTTDKNITITGLTNGQSYTFYIKAVNKAGESDAATVKAELALPETTPPVTPPTIPPKDGDNGSKDPVINKRNVYDINDFKDFNSAYTDPSAIYPSSPNTSNTTTGSYGSKTLTDSLTGVSVKGNIAPNAKLVVEKVSNANAIVQFDISIDGEYTGDIEISIPVGEKYNGKTVVVTHQMKSAIETFNPTVQNGYVNIKVDNFSPFIVTEVSGNISSKSSQNDTYNPKTGGELPQGTANHTMIYRLVLMSISFTMVWFGIRKYWVR